MPLSVDEVSDVIYDFVCILGIDKPVILGHSYGGRIRICNYALNVFIKSWIVNLSS